MKDTHNIGCQRWLTLGLTAVLLIFPLWAWGFEPISTSSRPSIKIRLFLNQVWRTNPSIQSAKASVDAASANALALSRPLYNPELEFDGERVSNVPEDDTYTVEIKQTIDLFNKRGANRRVGQLTLAQAQAILAAQRLSVGIAALTALREFNTDHAIVVLAKQRTKLLKRFVDATDKKYAAGDLDQASLDQSRLTLSEAIAQQANAEVTLSQAKEALAAITNRMTDAWPALQNHLPGPPHLSDVSVRLLRQLPSLQILNYRTITANARIKVAETNTRPDPTIGVRGGQEDKNALIGLSLNIPLFVRNNFQAQVTSACHEAIAADKTRVNAYWHAKARLNATASRYEILYRAYKQWSSISTRSLKSGITLLDKLWEAGEINTTDYLIQLKLRIDSQIAGVELQGETWQAWLEWLDASGNLDRWLGLTS